MLFQLAQVLGVGGDPGLLHPGEHSGDRQLQVGEQVGGVPLGELVAQCAGQLQHGSGADRAQLTLARTVEHQHLLGSGIRLGAQLAADEPHGQVRQGVGALVRVAQVGGHRGVEDHPVQAQPASVQGVPGGLRLVQHLGCRRVGQPSGQRGLVLG